MSAAMQPDDVVDTRTPSPVLKGASNGDGDGDTGGDVKAADTPQAYTADLSQEVAMLSTKLVNAINYQTNLDDSLQATRHELDRAQQDLKRLRAEKKSLDDAITQGVLVKKSEMDKTIASLRVELVREKASREQAEKLKRQTDSELETLTANLFEEANKMVASARRHTDAAEKKNIQLKSQMQDTEILLASQQEQLQDLKLTMEKLERVDTAMAARDSSQPSTPINSAGAVWDAMYTSSPGVGGTPILQEISPNHPLHFSNLLHPVLRTDIAAYTDFTELLQWARSGRNGANTNPHSRNASGNTVSSQATVTGASSSQVNLSALSQTAANNSSPNLPGAFNFGSASASNSPSSSNTSHFAPFTPPLKDSKFYRRCLAEDLEPTLRLDLAPGLSFLSRRAVFSSLLSGTLSIEPFTPPTKFYSPIFACSLCGESRKPEPFVRRHRFRTSDSDDANRYPLCGWCLERVRASADLIQFMRMVREGVWRCGDERDEKGAWEEGVRLRERCFWARIGGGVVPVGLAGRRGSAAQDAVGARNSGGGDRASVNGEDDEVVVRNLDSGVQQAAADVQTTFTLESAPNTAADGSHDEAGDTDGVESEQEQMGADSQLQREQSDADKDADEEMRTPPETPSEAVEPPTASAEQQDEVSTTDATAGATEPPSTAPDQDRPSTPPPTDPTPDPALDPTPVDTPNSRPASSTTPKPSSRPQSSSSNRPPSPRKLRGEVLQPPTRPSLDERRPSSVLARVRAMEGQAKK